MITSLANMIADFFIKKNTIKSDEREIYIYGCEALLSAAINFAITILCGLITNEICNIMIFYFVFLIMRKYCGGYHAKTHLNCNITFTLNILIVILLIKNISIINIEFYIVAIITSNILIIWLSPIENINKPLMDPNVKIYKKTAIILSLIFTVITVLLMFFNKTVSIIITLALLSVSLAMIIAKLMEKVEVNKNES